MIRFENLYKSYSKQHILKGLNLELENKGITAILGPNGSGKTTMIKCLLGLVKPDKGNVFLHEENLKKSYKYRKQLSYLPQVSRFPDNLKAKELIRLIKDLRNQEANEAYFLKVFKLEDLLEKKMGQLSGGERQKINLCLTLMFDSSIIVLDEPSAGLDPVSLLHLKKYLLEQKKAGKLIIFTTHIMPLVEELADQIVFLLEGNIHFSGSLKDLLAAEKKRISRKSYCQHSKFLKYDFMIRIFQYSFSDMMRSRWIIIYACFFLLVSFALLLLSNDHAKVLISLSQIVLGLVPLIALLFGIMYYYNYREFIEFLLAQPISRTSVFMGLYLGLLCSLCLSIILGISIPLLIYGVLVSNYLIAFLLLIVVAIVLTVVFTLIAFNIALRNENRIRGFGIAIFFWLIFAIVYDGVFLLLLMVFKEYPLENLTMVLVVLNPIDLSRILLLLQLEMSAILGYTGAVLHKFLGSGFGSFIILIVLALWMIIPFATMISYSNKKDF